MKDLPINQIIQGDALKVLKTFPDESIDCVVTSPPYWMLRDYGVEGQIGLEPTPQEYINKLCQVFDEIKRVLKKTGTCWVNMGDTYIRKCLGLIPSRFAIEMVERDTMDIYELDKSWIICNNISIKENKNAIQRPRKKKGILQTIQGKMESQKQGTISKISGGMEKKQPQQNQTIQSQVLLGKQRKRNNPLYERECQKTQTTEIASPDKIWRKSSEVWLLWGGKDIISNNTSHLREWKYSQERNKKIWYDLRVVKENELSRRFYDFMYELQLGNREIWFLPPSRGRNLCFRKKDIPLELLPLFKLKKKERWVIRNELIWHKPNCMPQSVKDRFTVDFEKVFFFVKNKKYWFEQQFEPHKENSVKRIKRAQNKNEKYNPHFHKTDNSGMAQSVYEIMTRVASSGGLNPKGRNKRCVWSIPTKPFKDAHFAVYPEDLIEPMIKAGCPEFVCNKCNKPREKIISIERPSDYNPKSQDKRNSGRGNKSHHRPLNEIFNVALRSKRVFKGYSDCNCKAGFHSGIVLDPFIGSGTTAVVAKKLGRNYIGIELNPDYIKIANKRLAQQTLL